VSNSGTEIKFFAIIRLSNKVGGAEESVLFFQQIFVKTKKDNFAATLRNFSRLKKFLFFNTSLSATGYLASKVFDLDRLSNSRKKGQSARDRG